MLFKILSIDILANPGYIRGNYLNPIDNYE